MGAVQSSINAETSTVAGAVVIGSIAVMATAYQFIGQKKASDVSKEKSQPQPAPSKKGKKKGTTGADDDFDKIVAAAAAENAAVAEASKRANAVAFPDVVPGSFDATASVGAQDEDGTGAGAKKDKKKAKKKAKKTANLAASASSIGADDSGVPESDPKAASGSRILPTVVSVDESIVHVPADGPSEAPRPSKGKKKKNAKAENANVSGTQTNGSTAATATPGPSSTPKPSSSTPKPKITSTTDSLDDGTWTRVSSRKNTSAPGMQQSQSLSQSEILTSDTNLTASVTGDTETSSVGSAAKPDTASEDEEVQEVKRKTFAEKMLPKRRTGVEEFVFYTSSFSSLMLTFHYTVWKKNLYNHLSHVSSALLPVPTRSLRKVSVGVTMRTYMSLARQVSINRMLTERPALMRMGMTTVGS